MLINHYPASDFAIIEPVGRLTANTTEPFTQAVAGQLDAGSTRIVIDLKQVPDVDSEGLGVLVNAFTSARRRGGRAVFVHASGRVLTLLRLTRLTSVLEVCETLAEAERRFERTIE
jgi:anti-sigma B factor antagonist